MTIFSDKVRYLLYFSRYKALLEEISVTHYKSTLIVLIIIALVSIPMGPVIAIPMMGIALAYAIAAPIYAKEKAVKEDKPE